jgi:hypothetical protein
MASKTPAGRASALRAPFGVWGQTQRRRTFLLGVWGGADVEILAYILFRAAEGAHAPLSACSECGPAEAHLLLHFVRTSNELYVDPDPHPGGYQYLLFESY